jgi:methylsterol monooxygenase
LNSTLASSTGLPNASYFELIALAAKQSAELSLLEQIWWAHYAYWQSGIIATGMHILAHQSSFN